ncbi:hypothetical protein [Coleofasciculus sp. E2-BRE-01]|uniref:hypothetical protein n=1 Tax=Coleofasciculus sp. E2-BRE-01 TaxID=3069524 RepID=UPI0032F6027F
MNDSNSIDLDALNAITAIAATTTQAAQPNQLKAWLEATKILTLPWAKPLLPAMGIPEALIEHSASLGQLHEQLSESIQQQTNPEPAIRETIQQLAEQTTSGVASEFKDWVERHFIDQRLWAALEAWWGILYRAVHFHSVSSPVSWQRLHPQIAELISPQQWQQLEEQLQHLAPPPSQEEERLGLTLCADALRIQEIINHEWTFATLKLIKTEVSETEWTELKIWAETIAEEMGIPSEELFI